VLDFLQLANLKHPFMMHFFSGSVSEAKRAIELGGLISITPLHSKGRRQVIKETDLANLLIETDAPYVVRKPEEVIKSAEYISEIKGVGLDEVVQATTENAIRFFNILV
jgi:TatD DNase family protein